MLYHFYEWNHAALTPLRAVADVTKLIYKNPFNPLSQTTAGRTIAAMAEVFERTTRVYGKPSFGLNETVVDGRRVPVVDKPVWERPFCKLLHFERELPWREKRDPRILIVAPMSGHYATLLRGTVEALLPYAEVYITDWQDARMVPLAAGRFDLDDYVDTICDMLRFIGPDTHVIGVCQPAVPVLMATAVMSEAGDPAVPSTMTLMGGPIDTRINPTAVNRLAQEKGIDWFRENVIMPVPFPQPGFMRMVYPGFLQLSGFMSMNLDRHMIATKDFFWHLVKNDGEPAEKHREFYDEYNAVMDLTAEFYLQTVEEVFIRHSLPKGEITHRGRRIDASKITRTALLTIEGENDDISGVGQTKAAHVLCSSLPEDMRVHYLQPKVGHYGVFNGSRYRAEIAPRIVDFALTHGRTHSEASLPRRSGATKPAETAPNKASLPEEMTANADAESSFVAAAALDKPEVPEAVALKAAPPAATAEKVETGARDTPAQAKSPGKPASARAEEKASPPLEPVSEKVAETAEAPASPASEPKQPAAPAPMAAASLPAVADLPTPVGFPAVDPVSQANPKAAPFVLADPKAAVTLPAPAAAEPVPVEAMPSAKPASRVAASRRGKRV